MKTCLVTDFWDLLHKADLAGLVLIMLMWEREIMSGEKETGRSFNPK